MERPKGLAPLGPGGRQPDIRGIRLGQGAVAVDGEPGVEAVVLGLGKIEARRRAAM